MKPTLLNKLLMVVLLFTSVQLFAQSFTFGSQSDIDNNFEGAGNNKVTLTYNALGSMDITTTKASPGVKPKSTTAINADQNKKVKIVFWNNSNATQFRIRTVAGTTNYETEAITTSATADYVTYVYDFSAVAEWTSANVSDFMFQFRDGANVITGNIHISEISYLPPPTFDDYYGFEQADAVTYGVIDPSANGNSKETGWFFAGTPKFAFSDAKVASGDYSLKYSSVSADGDVTAQGGGTNASGSSYPVSLLDLAAGTYNITMDVHVEALGLSKIAHSIKGTNPFISVLYDLPTAVSTGNTFTTITSAEFDVPIGGITDAQTTLKVLAANVEVGKTPIVYFDNIKFNYLRALSVENYQQLKGVNIYPNPASDILAISCPEGSSVGVYNLLGAKLKSVERASRSFNMEVSDLATGLYIVRVESKGKFYSKKVQIK